MSSVAQLLADLADEELGLVAAERYDDLPDLHRRRDEALAALPPGPPSPEDRPLLEHALAVQMQVTRHLEGAREEVRGELQRLSHRRTAARGYAAVARA
jgi:hypothetical protein